MALKTDDEDIRDVRMWVEVGGNGDYYICLMELNKVIRSGNIKVDKQNIRVDTRVAMSGGNAPTSVKLAVANLFRAMEKAGLNKHPKEEK